MSKNLESGWRLAWRMSRNAKRLSYQGECPCGCGGYVVIFEGRRIAVKERHYRKLLSLALK